MSVRKRGKYEGINPLEKLGIDEPFFMIRGQDRLSVQAVTAYSHLLQVESDKATVRGEEELAKSLQEQSLEVVEFAHRFLDWQEANPDKVKFPD